MLSSSIALLIFKWYIIGGVLFMMFFSFSDEYSTSITNFRQKCIDKNISFFRKWMALILGHAVIVLVWLPCIIMAYSK